MFNDIAQNFFSVLIFLFVFKNFSNDKKQMKSCTPIHPQAFQIVKQLMAVNNRNKIND